MASYAQPAQRLPANTGEFIAFLRAELAPQPGMLVTWARVLVTLVLVFLIAAIFQLPYAAVTLYSVFLVDRSSRRAALINSLENIIGVIVGVAVALLGVELFIAEPLLTFAWYALELFCVAFLVRTTRLLGPALQMGIAVYTVHNIWESPYPAVPHLEQTLWVLLTLSLGFAVAVAVEYMFVREDLFANIVARIDGRLRALSDFYSRWAIRSPNLEDAHKSVAAYAWRSTAGIRHTIATLRTTDPQSQERLLALSTITALTARLIDVTATLDPSVALSEEDSSRLLKLAAELDRISKAHNAGEILTVHDYQPSGAPSAAIPVLPELERTAAMIPNAVSSEERKYEAIVQPSTADERTRIFIPDAFSNPAYLIFAMKTMLAALLCYVIYSGLDWQGVSTSVVTCLVTALNTSGATRQKQLLRLTGAVFGGVLALGSIVLLLPETDRLTGVTLLVTAVSAFCAWFALASQRVSYFGLQAALAFYLALIQDYRTTTDLAPARDRALGVLLGVAVMWLVFDNLWPVSATKLMVTWFVRNVRSVGQVLPTMDQPNRALAIQTLRSLRDRIQNGFTTANGHADSVLFEFGSRNRAQHLALRNEVLRAQATLRTLFTVELAISQVRQSSSIPLTTALENFDQMISKRLENIANAVEQGRAPEPSSEHVDFDSLPDGALRPLLKRALELTDTLEEQCRWHVNWGERVGELAKS